MSETLPEPTGVEVSDAALISRIREGDVSAYGVLYERHVGAARRLARHLLNSEAEAEDAVSETFTKVLAVLERGGGPQSAFRPYLLTAVRRTVYDRYRSDKRITPTDEIEAYDSGAPFVDPAFAGLERNLIVRAFLSLPERWQAVLWHTEIEGGKPAEVAPLLGLTANGAAALAYRAREGLREAYLQMHIADGPRAECRPALDRLGAYVRGGLAKRDSALVERHLDGCADCKAIYAELADVNTTLRAGVGPLVLGLAAAAYLAAAAAKGGTAIGGWLFGWWPAVRRLPKRQQQALAGGTVAATAAVAVAAFLLVENSTPVEHHPVPPPVAAPVPPVPPKPQPPHAAPPPPPPPPAPPAPPGAPGAPRAPQKPAPARPAATPPPASQPSQAPTQPPTPPSPPPADLVPEIGTVGILLRSALGIVAVSVTTSWTPRPTARPARR